MANKIKENYNSPRITGEVLDCSLPVTFDTYSNCSYGCVYCFSQYMRAKGGGKENYLKKQVRSVNINKVKEIFTLKRETPYSDFIRARKPIQWGGLSDQFDGFERKYGKTLELLKFFKEIDYPICFSTKATWFLDDKRYTDLIKGQDNWNCKFSIITKDETAAKIIEPGVPTPDQRIMAIEKYANLQAGGATLRLRPFIIGVSSKDYKKLITESFEAGADAMTTEFFCLDRLSVTSAKDSYKTISDYIGHDIVDFYAKNSVGAGYLRLNRKIKEPYIRQMKNLCNKLGMRFYVSDAHFKECSEGTCCCGLKDSYDFSRNHFAEALQLCKKNGSVRFSDIAGGAINSMTVLDSQVLGSTESRAKFGGMTLNDYMRYHWNNPKGNRSPYKYFNGVMRPDGLDENGDIIYIYDKTKTFEHD